MPLSGIGLCDAESITPRSALASAVRNATAGVGSTPTRTTLAPALVSPATTAASSISPLARVSRPTTASGGWLRSCLGQCVRGGHRERQRQLRGEIRVCPPAYAVRAEQPTHTRQPPNEHCL